LNIGNGVSSLSRLWRSAISLAGVKSGSSRFPSSPVFRPRAPGPSCQQSLEDKILQKFQASAQLDFSPCPAHDAPLIEKGVDIE
jgi:hypothetical protein